MTIIHSEEKVLEG